MIREQSGVGLIDMKIAVFAIAFAVLAFSQPAAGEQSEGKIPRIGYLSFYSEQQSKKFLAAFLQGLKDLGYVEGKNIVIEVRYAMGKIQRVPARITELIRLKPDIIVAGGRAALIAKKLSSTIPIVVPYNSNILKQGLVASLSRPGGNVTGLSNLTADLGAKRLELIKEFAPSALSVAVFFNPADSGSRQNLKAVQAAAPALGVTVLPVAVEKGGDFDRAFATIRRERPGGLVQTVGLGRHRKRIVELAAKAKLPAIYVRRQWVDAGGLMSYGASWPDLFRRAATYVDKILKGAKPGELPVEQPTKFDFIVNLKTAKALGGTIPPSILLRATEVIE
jgi:putative ABC transport system substrate-binding protein